jgi:hypothetical protein
MPDKGASRKRQIEIAVAIRWHWPAWALIANDPGAPVAHALWRSFALLF